MRGLSREKRMPIQKFVPEELAAAITPHTRWLVLNSPSDPTGAIYSRHELASAGRGLLAHEHYWSCQTISTNTFVILVISSRSRLLKRDCGTARGRQRRIKSVFHDWLANWVFCRSVLADLCNRNLAFAEHVEIPAPSVRRRPCAL